MRVVLLGSSIPNMLNYGLQFSIFARAHEFTIALLVPNADSTKCQEMIAGFLRTTNGKNMRVHPMFLNFQHNRLRNLINVPLALKDFSSIFKTLKHLAPDVVICYYLLDAYPFILLKKILHYSLYVVAMGGDVNLHEGLFYRSMRKFIYRGSDSIFVVSFALRDKIENESGRQTIVARTGIDANFFMPLKARLALKEKWRFGPKDQVLLMVCNLVKHKGVDIAIEALSLLSTENSSIKLVIVGSGPEERRLKQLTLELHLKGKVLFLGTRNRQELLELYNAADVFVLASFSEGLPFVLLEAMACGRVCVATEVGDIPTVIIPGENGFLVPSRDPVALAKTINNVFSLSKEDSRSVQKRAREIVRDSFDFRFSVNEMIKSIECKEAGFRRKSKYVQSFV